MKLTHVVTACNEKQLYSDCIDPFVKVWKGLFPSIKITILYTHYQDQDKYPPNISEENQKYIIPFQIPSKITSSAFVAQNIRILYPVTVQDKNDVIMITDIDILPASRKYFVENLAPFSEKCFVTLRNDCQYHQEVCICYNVATPVVWGQLFVNEFEEFSTIDNILTQWFLNVEYYEGEPGKKGWNHDQVQLYRRLVLDPPTNFKWINLNDQETNFMRICRDRNEMKHYKMFEKLVKKEHFADFHMFRPMSDPTMRTINENYIDMILDIPPTTPIISLRKKNEEKLYFCFCLYGSGEKYCQGMIENLKIIREYYPTATTYIALGNNVPQKYILEMKTFKFLRLKMYNFCDQELMVYRYFCYDECRDRGGAVCFFRDSDSLINARDRWCIDTFLQRNDKCVHIIRDHYWHKTRIPGGLWGIRQENGPFEMNLREMFTLYRQEKGKTKHYGIDQEFLEEMIYPLIPKEKILLHTNLNRFQDEAICAERIEFENNGHNFLGNVMEMGKPVFHYYSKKEFHFSVQLEWLKVRGAWEIIRYIYDHEYDAFCTQYSPEERFNFNFYFLEAFFEVKEYQKCLNITRRYEFCPLSEKIILYCNQLIPSTFPIVGTTFQGKDHIAQLRKQYPDSYIIMYGNYPWSYKNIPHEGDGRVLYRHVKYYKHLKHDFFESDNVWDAISHIYILNLEERVDRYMEILMELCRVHAPLPHIHHYIAKKETITGVRGQDVYIGATKNHCEVLGHFYTQSRDSAKKCALILEDDFMFTSSVEDHLNDLKLFFERKYSFDVCLLSTSKNGLYVSHDDLLYRSYQPCTTSSGYLVNRETVKLVYDTLKEGYKALKEGGDPNIYCCDRYWSKLQNRNQFFIFKQKMGFQRANYSNINQRVTFNFD